MIVIIEPVERKPLDLLLPRKLVNLFLKGLQRVVSLSKVQTCKNSDFYQILILITCLVYAKTCGPWRMTVDYHQLYPAVTPVAYGALDVCVHACVCVCVLPVLGT